jgi:hypothetical protein
MRRPRREQTTTVVERPNRVTPGVRCDVLVTVRADGTGRPARARGARDHRVLLRDVVRST